MGMADPWPETVTLEMKLTLVRSAPEDGLTCWFCRGPRCEWETTLRLGGTTLGVGVHEACRVRFHSKEASDV